MGCHVLTPAIGDTNVLHVVGDGCCIRSDGPPEPTRLVCEMVFDGEVDDAHSHNNPGEGILCPMRNTDYTPHCKAMFAWPCITNNDGHGAFHTLDYPLTSPMLEPRRISYVGWSWLLCMYKTL